MISIESSCADHELHLSTRRRLQVPHAEHALHYGVVCSFVQLLACCPFRLLKNPTQPYRFSVQVPDSNEDSFFFSLSLTLAGFFGHRFALIIRKDFVHMVVVANTNMLKLWRPFFCFIFINKCTPISRFGKLFRTHDFQILFSQFS